MIACIALVLIKIDSIIPNYFILSIIRALGVKLKVLKETIVNKILDCIDKQQLCLISS